jgi:protein TonB
MKSKFPLRKAAAIIFALALPTCALAWTTRASSAVAPSKSAAAVEPSAPEPAAARQRSKRRGKRARRGRTRRARPRPPVLAPQIIPPSGGVTVVKQPTLPVPATIQADPMLLPPDTREIPYGDPKAREGMGVGAGVGDGGGVGPGRGSNTGSGVPYEGGGGPGRSGPVDYTRVFRADEVTQKAVITSKPDPGYTTEARKNQVTGSVRLRVVLNASGTVTNISVVKGLPDGLTERTIAAARQVKFRPAQKDGRAVSQWVVLEYNFNIY